jgi:hypothetical protein
MGLCQPAQVFDALEGVDDQTGQRRQICQVERPPFFDPAPKVLLIGARIEAEAVLHDDRSDLGPKLAGGWPITEATTPFGCMEKLVKYAGPPGPQIVKAPGPWHLDAV